MTFLLVATLFGVVVNTVLLIVVLRKKEADHAEIMPLLRLNVEAAQSARISRKEETIARSDVVAKVEEAKKELVQVIPERSATKVAEILGGDGAGGHT